jgi:hypothetical protein
MIIKTKKIQLNKKFYVKHSLFTTLKRKWWFFLIPIALIGISVFIFSWWWIILGILVAVLFIIFWLIQFVGITMLEQNKVMFDKLFYEIDSRQILMKINPHQGMQLKWNQIIKAKKDNHAYYLYLNKVQFLYLPFKSFNSDAEMKFFESLLKKNNLLKAK